MRVAVLGGTRFIGPAIVDALRARGHDVTVLHRGRSAPHLGDVDEVRLDRGDGVALAAALARAEVIIDTCAFNRTDADIATAAMPAGTRSVVLSSMDVYRAFGAVLAGRTSEPVPLTERSPVREHRYPYRGSGSAHPVVDVDTYEKLDVERTYLAAGAVVLRLPMVFGERDPQRREEFILRRVRAGRTQIPFGSGTWLWSRGWVRDVGAAAALAAESPLTTTVLNVCEPQACTIELWARSILEAAGSPAELVRVPDDELPEDLWITRSIGQHVLADPSLARRLLAWDATDPVEAIHASVAWHLANPPPETDADFSADDKALRAR